MSTFVTGVVAMLALLAVGAVALDQLQGAVEDHIAPSSVHLED
jgi:hypothetical protein